MIRPLLLATITFMAIAAIACSDDETPSEAQSPSAGEGTASASAPRAQRTIPPLSEDLSKGINWEDCDDGFECGTLFVPVDHITQEGGRVGLKVTRHRAPQGDGYLGPLFVNPGGPGYSAVGMAQAAQAWLPREILDRFDIIGFDPRGVAESEGIDCGEGATDYSALDYSPEDSSERAALIEYARTYAGECAQYNERLLSHVGTKNAAADMESVRIALGAERINYFGYSYGTLLGAAYAEAYPERVRAFVLDSALDPLRDPPTRLRDSGLAFEHAFDAFLDECGAHPSCDFYSDGDPRAAYDALIARLEAEPIPAVLYEEGVTTTADDAREAVASALYDEASWTQLAYALVVADRDNDGTYLLDIAYPSSDDEEEELNTGDPNSAINCADAEWPDDVRPFDDALADLRAKAPRAGITSVFYNLPCVYWSAPSDPLGLLDAQTAPPILVVGATGDPATPYEWSRALADELTSGVLLTFEGYVHGVAFSNTSRCTDDAAVLYLTELTVPADGAICSD